MVMVMVPLFACNFNVSVQSDVWGIDFYSVFTNIGICIPWIVKSLREITILLGVKCVFLLLPESKTYRCGVKCTYIAGVQAWISVNEMFLSHFAPWSEFLTQPIFSTFVLDKHYPLWRARDRDITEMVRFHLKISMFALKLERTRMQRRPLPASR